MGEFPRFRVKNVVDVAKYCKILMEEVSHWNLEV